MDLCRNIVWYDDVRVDQVHDVAVLMNFNEVDIIFCVGLAVFAVIQNIDWTQ